MNFNDTDKEELAKLGVRRHFRKPTGYEHYLRIGEVLNQRLTESQSFIDDATNPIVRFAWHQCFHPGRSHGTRDHGAWTSRRNQQRWRLGIISFAAPAL